MTRLPRQLAGGLAAALALAAPAAAAPIPDPTPTSLPLATGSAAVAHSLQATIAPQNPFMARNPDSNIHGDTWMTDAYRRSGPLGSNLRSTSSAMLPALCGSIAFDHAGRIVSVCPSIV